jgi:hypothetical protein
VVTRRPRAVSDTRAQQPYGQRLWSAHHLQLRGRVKFHGHLGNVNDRPLGLEILREVQYRDTRRATRCGQVSLNGKCRMIDAEAAAKKALEYFTGLYPGAAGGAILLEEVELTGDRKFWLITLSYTPPPENPLLPFIASGREFKTFRVSAETGEVV